MPIDRRAVYAYLDRELDSYVWMKGLRRHALMRELDGLRVRPKFKTEGWLHQLVCFYIGICLPEFLFLLDMGLGKSWILMNLIQQRIRERSVQHALVTVPNVINMASWSDDLARHSYLEPWACDVEDIEAKWERLSNPKGDVTFIDYQGLTLALTKKVKSGGRRKNKLVVDEDRVALVRRLYQFTGMDESHKLRNHQNLWFTIMRDITEAMRYVYATTGTPFDKNPDDMWSQFYLVDRGRTFGENLGLFHEAFFTKEQSFKGDKWEFRKKMAPELHRMMQHRSLRYDEKEVPEIDLPARNDYVRRVHLTDEQNGHYLRALEGLINASGSGDSAKCEAPWVRMRQIISGYLVWEDSHGRHVTYFKENPKLALLEYMLREMGDSKVVVTYYYTDTGRMLVKRLEELGIGCEWLYGGTKDKVGARERFMTDPKCRVFVMNSEAGGTGNDGLQKVARYMIFYETPTPPSVRKQVEKRLYRPGQRERTFFYDLVGKGTVDQGILNSIAEGHDLFSRVVNGKHQKRDFIT